MIAELITSRTLELVKMKRTSSPHLSPDIHTVRVTEREREMAIHGRQQQKAKRKFQWWRLNTYSLRRMLIVLVVLAFTPPIFFHFRLKRFQQMRLKKCNWLNNPPLVCAHGGDSSTNHAFPNTMSAYRAAIVSQVDCIEIDVSRSSDGVLFALHDRDLQRLSGNKTARVGHFTMREIKEINGNHPFAEEFLDREVPTIEDALALVSKSVRQVILDAKVGPPNYEKGLATDILSAKRRCDETKYPASRSEFLNRLISSDNLARDVIKLTSDIPVGYIVMRDPSTGARTNLLRIKAAGVVGVYHPLIDENLVKVVHGRKKKVYAWTVDESDSMKKMLFEHVDAIVTSYPTLLQRLMHHIRIQCFEEGFSLL
ncbi:Glycerophosphodiester phosphodiesterase [Thalictrum thalictroides]|uniref:glycerophosphodiester phosphodiesterase n=1 Tax=Thalictrum thalictroides TaxID=46969 RepID=A0A7J6XAD3_THATH|nr:Glycerophosphodiester phosphodiesterase [Thalictrum thalictroides]